MGDAPPLRVLQVVGPSAGGIGRHVAELTRRLSARGHDVRIAGPPGSSATDAAVPFHDVPVGRRSTVATVRSLRPLCRGVDVIHAHGLTAGWTATVARPAVPVVVTVHNVVLDHVEGSRAPWLRRLERRLPARVARTIAVSDEIARRLTGCAGSGRIDVIAPVGPPPVPSRSRDGVRSALAVPDGVPLLVLVGRLHPQKGIDTFLTAVGQLTGRGCDVRAAVVGDGPEAAALHALRDRLGLGGVVSFVGAKASAADEVAAADVLVCSSIWESFGLVVAEALELARPVVATAVGRIPEMLGDAGGLMVPPGDPTALAGAIAEQLSDPRRAAAGAAEGQARVRSLFRADALVDQIISCYRRAVDAA